MGVPRRGRYSCYCSQDRGTLLTWGLVTDRQTHEQTNNYTNIQTYKQTNTVATAVKIEAHFSHVG